MGGVSQTRMMLIAETLFNNVRSVGTIFALFKKRMPVNRGIRLYQLSNSGIIYSNPEFEILAGFALRNFPAV